MTELERFLGRVVVVDNGCWLWNGYRRTERDGSKSYGWLTFRGVQTGAHRASWILHRGTIPAGVCVCHRCDVPACVNPDHLFLGTQTGNVMDMISKGRKWSGTVLRKRDGRPARSLLTDEQIKAIRVMRDSGASQSAIADAHGVSQGCISQLLRGITNYAKRP